jgi:hypothetical protein
VGNDGVEEEDVLGMPKKKAQLIILHIIMPIPKN